MRILRAMDPVLDTNETRDDALTAMYADWAAARTPAGLGRILTGLDPIITQEVHRISGPKPLLRSRARVLTAKAIQAYDPTRGVPIGAYVRQQLQPLTRYSANMRPLRVSEALVQRAAELNSRRMELANQLDRDPTDDELADHVGISVPRIRQLRSQVPVTVNESRIVNEEGENFLPAQQDNSELDTAVEAVYGGLDQRQRQIYDWRVGANGPALSNKEIAQRLGITPSAASQTADMIAKRIQEAHRHALPGRY